MLGLGAPLVSFSLISSAPLTAALRLRAGHSQAAALAEEFQQNGAVVLRGFLSPSLLEKCRKVYDDALNQPVRRGAQVKYPDGTLYNPAIGHRTDDEAVLDMVNEVPFASTLAELWGSESVWFFDHELWWKRHGDSDNGRSAERSDTPFHQDSLAVPFRGLHVGLFWICFQPIPKENCLQVVKGSHRGPVYQLAPGTIFGMDPDEPMVPESVQPVMPMTEDERAHWEYCAWDLEPGDVVVVHPGTIHGSAPVSASCPERHTLVLRFVGDDCWFSKGAVYIRETREILQKAFLPSLHNDKGEYIYDKELRPGDHFSSFLSPQSLLLGPGVTAR
ncbi:hypothetical protein EMIHUDRAFT_442573 [Emiliania huxleyi CCMP1516]|uniref:Phytanoyl-CoA dioxygenase n=2 Tax=Emiliania huxleyi TaxID=2903 RepID=A0A0D3K3E1_EMIH1|nr:hypothetical protein EMIHUDRAFT_442573 [Emiliania huxleyi CCMP1516]EOD30276.1 hypothetical protein EMIHUDRAFT_442573 [Emiliania huxleyi CCMP1516]|eukprot:XP_005782705.1 hypothetical protein EMIHUDRAFT_442573 [Emiliania huxleyi CCMP1516]